MRQYELTYLISDNVPESDLNKITGKVEGYIREAGGKLLKEEIWGRRKLAYPIKKQEFATYVTVNFDLTSDKAFDFEHNIFMTSKIVRHLMIVKDFGEEVITLTKEDIAGTKEIEEVIGGEKSFEVIEGETEESKDLMSVRSEKEETISEDKEKEVATVVEESPVTKEIVEVKEVTKEDKKVKTKETKSEAEANKISKKVTKKSVKKEKVEVTEADRLSKLDKELDDILGEEL